MHAQHRTAGLRLPALGGALALSVLAHAAAVSVWLGWWPSGGPAAMARHRGGLSARFVTLVPARQSQPRPALAPPPPSALPPVTHATPKAHHRVHAAHVASHAPPPDPAPAAPPSTQAETPKVTQAGARFASLFAPILQRPLGTGHWGTPRPNAPPPQAEAQIRLAQAMAAMRQAAQDRVAHLAVLLRTQALHGHCEARLSLARQQVLVQCPDPADQALTQAVLGEGLRATAPKDMPPDAGDICLRAEGQGLQWLPCEPASMAKADAPR